MPMPTHVIADIGRKCDEDVSAAIMRNMNLMDTVDEASQVAFLGAASAIGTAAGAFLAKFEAEGLALPAEGVADALWLILRPMVERSVVRMRERKA